MKFPAFDPSSPQTLKVTHLLAIPTCKYYSTIKTHVRVWLRVKPMMATLKKKIQLELSVIEGELLEPAKCDP